MDGINVSKDMLSVYISICRTKYDEGWCSTMEKHKVHVNGIDMVYEECGHDNEKTIVLLHGFCGSSLYWHKLCPTLGENYRLIMPQLRGHGESSTPDEVYTMETMADDVYKLIETLEVDKVTMFGHSLGGYVTLAFAEKYSDKLSGFGLIHSTAQGDSNATKEKRRKDIENIFNNGIINYINQLIPGLFIDSKLWEMQEEVHEVIRAGMEMTSEGAIHTLEGMMQRPDRSKVITEAKFPILLVAGADDEVISPELAYTITVDGKSVTSYEYAHIMQNTFEGVAHMSLIEVPDQLSRVIVNYLKILHEKESKRAV